MSLFFVGAQKIGQSSIFSPLEGGGLVSKTLFLSFPLVTSVIAVLSRRQDLFNAAFLTVWDDLFVENWDGHENHAPVIDALQSALSAPSLPPEIQTQLLRLAGFMELQDKPLILDTNFLASKALQSNELAQFLHYTEAEFLRDSQEASLDRGPTERVDEFFAEREYGGSSGWGSGATQNSRRRLLRVRTESATSAMDSDLNQGAGAAGWVGAWEGISTAVPVGGTVALEAGDVVDPTGLGVGTCVAASGAGSVAGSTGTATSSGRHGPSLDTLEALITVNHRLGLDMAAAGILRQAELQAMAGLPALDPRPSWLEKLQRWNDALMLYEAAIENCEKQLTSGRAGVGAGAGFPSPRAPFVTGGGGLGDHGVALGGAHGLKPVSLFHGLGDVASSRPVNISAMRSIGGQVAASAAAAAAEPSLVDTERLHLGSYMSDEIVVGGGEQSGVHGVPALAATVTSTDKVVEW